MLRGDARTERRMVALFRNAAVLTGTIALLIGGVTAGRAAVDTSDYADVTILPVDHSGGPATVDWRTSGAVTPVKNQGPCDASWAFGATGLVEAFHAIQSQQLRSLSEQQLLDCNPFGAGCGGGSPVAALRTLIAAGGLVSEAAYPYTAVQGTCHFHGTGIVATLPGAGRVPPGDEASLETYVATRGPVLALIDAGHASFEGYSGGVYEEPACSTTQPTQAVLIVGYGSMQGHDYWIVKNSWGVSWGMQGYILMSRNRNNNCGIASFALVASNDPLRAPIPAPMFTSAAATGLVALLSVVGVVGLRRRGTRPL